MRAKNRVCYYRDDKGLEVDAILERGTKWTAVQVKLSDVRVGQAAESLLRLRRKVVENPAAQNAKPAFMAVVTGKSTLAYRRKDGIYVIPAACLTACDASIKRAEQAVVANVPVAAYAV